MAESQNETHQSLLNEDDVFIMNNLGFLALKQGYGEEAVPLYKLLYSEYPQHASATFMHAAYLESISKIEEAIQLIEKNGVFSAKKAREECISLYFILLRKNGEVDKLQRIVNKMLAENYLQEEGTRQLAQSLLNDAYKR